MLHNHTLVLITIPDNASPYLLNYTLKGSRDDSFLKEIVQAKWNFTHSLLPPVSMEAPNLIVLEFRRWKDFHTMDTKDSVRKLRRRKKKNRRKNIMCLLTALEVSSKSTEDVAHDANTIIATKTFLLQHPSRNHVRASVHETGESVPTAASVYRPPRGGMESCLSDVISAGKKRNKKMSDDFITEHFLRDGLVALSLDHVIMLAGYIF